MTEGSPSPEDDESVVRASEHLHSLGWRKAFTLNEMVEGWRSLVDEVEQGYGESVHEYANDLACRDWLALVLPQLTPRLRQLRQAELDELDARFRAATAEDDAPLGRYSRTGPEQGWWWHRRPLLVIGDFAADLTEG